jgi:hypothetical protein
MSQTGFLTWYNFRGFMKQDYRNNQRMIQGSMMQISKCCEIKEKLGKPNIQLLLDIILNTFGGMGITGGCERMG